MHQLRVLVLTFLLTIYLTAAVAQFQSPIIMRPADPLAGFGFGLASGDVNGDGIADVVAGSVLSTASGTRNAGQAFVFFGGRGPHTSPDLVLQAPVPEAEARFGWSIAIGDVDGDGIGDIIVTTPFGNGGANGTGIGYVFLSGSSHQVVTLQIPSLNAKAHFGWSVAVGDINGDGFDDVIVGAENVRVGNHNEAGGVFIFAGSRPFTGALTATLQSPTPQKGGSFGWSVAVGNVNGDRFADVIVGAKGEDAQQVKNAGQAYVFFGSSSFDTIPDRTLQQPVPVAGSGFGQAVASGDLNGDGNDEAIVAAPTPNLTELTHRSEPGEVYVFPGGNPFVRPPIKIQSPSPAMNDGFGQTLAVGDTNRDGVKDLLVGMPLANVNSNNNAGQGFLFLGGVDLDPASDLTFQEPSPTANANFGLAMALADVNGDRRADAVISAPEPPSIRFRGGQGRVLAFLSR